MSATGERAGDAALRARFTLAEAQAVIEQHVLPYVRNHGGHIVATDVTDDGVVHCRLEGACRGCPAAPVTVVAVVERALRRRLAPGICVHAAQIQVSDAALERIRRFYPDRVSGPGRAPR